MARVKKKKAPEGYRWKTVTVPSTRPNSFTTKRVLVPIEGAEKEVVEAPVPALSMFDEPAPVTQAYGKHPGQAVDPNVDRTPLRRTPINLMGVEDWSGKGAERDEAGMEMWYQDRAREALRDKEGTSIAPESEVRSIAGLANTQQEWDAQQRARRQRLPPPLQQAINRGDREALFAGMDIIGQQSGLDPRTAVGPMAGPVRKVLSNLANATKKAVITSGAKKTVDKITAEGRKAVTTPGGQRTFIEGTTIPAVTRRAPRLGDKPVVSAEAQSVLRHGPRRGDAVIPARTSLVPRKGTAMVPAGERAVTQGRIPGGVVRMRPTAPVVAQDFQSTRPLRSLAAVEENIARGQRRNLANARTKAAQESGPTIMRPPSGQMVVAGERFPRPPGRSLATISRDPSRLLPGIARSRSLGKTAGVAALATGAGILIDQTLQKERAEDQTQAAIDAAVQARKDIVEDTESGLLDRGTAGRGGVSQDIGKLPKVGKGSDADQIAANPNLEKIWGKYAYDPKARAKKFNEGMNSIWRKMALLNAIAVMTGNESMAPAYMEMAMARMDRMDKFDEEARVSSLVKEVFTGPNGEFYMPKNKTEAAERAAKAGGLPATIKEIFGAVPKKETPAAAPTTKAAIRESDGQVVFATNAEINAGGFSPLPKSDPQGTAWERVDRKAQAFIEAGNDDAARAVWEIYYGSAKDPITQEIFGDKAAVSAAVANVARTKRTMGVVTKDKSTAGGDEAIPEAQALEILRKNPTEENIKYFEEAYGYIPDEFK
jgi:hypothetical protein